MNSAVPNSELSRNLIIIAAVILILAGMKLAASFSGSAPVLNISSGNFWDASPLV